MQAVAQDRTPCFVSHAEAAANASAHRDKKLVDAAHAVLRSEFLHALRSPDARKVLVCTPAFSQHQTSLVEAINCLPSGDADAFLAELLAIAQDAASSGNFRALRCLAQRASDHASYHADDAVLAMGGGA